MDHINNGPYQLLKKAPTTTIKAKRLQELKALKDNQFIVHLDFMVSQKHTSLEFLYVLLLYIAAPCCTVLTET